MLTQFTRDKLVALKLQGFIDVFEELAMPSQCGCDGLSIGGNSIQ